MPKRNKSKVIAKRREGKEPGVSKYAEKRRAKIAGLDNGNNGGSVSVVPHQENGERGRTYRKRNPVRRGNKFSGMDRG